jgi:hypothetical protein
VEYEDCDRDSDWDCDRDCDCYCDPKEQTGKDLEGAVDSYKSLSIARLLKCSKHFDGKGLEE